MIQCSEESTCVCTLKMVKMSLRVFNKKSKDPRYEFKRVRMLKYSRCQNFSHLTGTRVRRSAPHVSLNDTVLTADRNGTFYVEKHGLQVRLNATDNKVSLPNELLTFDGELKVVFVDSNGESVDDTFSIIGTGVCEHFDCISTAFSA